MSLARYWARVQSKYYRSCAENLFRRSFELRLAAPLISFTFDDFPRTALSAGGETLRRRGLAGTYYVSLGLAGKRDDAGEMFTAEDLYAVRRDGHELGCHTYAHCDSAGTPTAQFERSLLDNEDALHRIWPDLNFRTFSYPKSAPGARTKRATAKHFEVSRGSGQAPNTGTADLNYLKAFFLEKTGGDLDPIQQVIAANNQARGWLIFATHDISPQPSRYGCTPGFFESVVQLSVQSGATVLPVGQAWDLLRRSSRT